MKSLDARLADLRSNPASPAFIIADARDADMASGVRAPGSRSFLSRRGARSVQFSPQVWSRNEFSYRDQPEFLDIIREINQQEFVEKVRNADDLSLRTERRSAGWPTRSDGAADFDRTTPGQRTAYFEARLRRRFS